MREVSMSAFQPEGQRESADSLTENRRARVRHVTNQTALCQTSTAQGDDFWLLGKIQDVSTRGTRLWLRKPFQVGELLAIEPTQVIERLTNAPQARAVYCSR